MLFAGLRAHSGFLNPYLLRQRRRPFLAAGFQQVAVTLEVTLLDRGSREVEGDECGEFHDVHTLAPELEGCSIRATEAREIW